MTRKCLSATLFALVFLTCLQVGIANAERYDLPSELTRLPFDNVLTIAGALSISGDGRIAAHISDARKVIVWNTSNLDVLFTIEAGDKQASVVALDSSGSRLAIGHDLAAVELWSLPDRKEVASIEAPNHSVSSLAFSPDGKHLAIGKSRTGVTEVWDIARGQKIRELPSKYSPEGWGDLGEPISVGFTGNGQALVVNEWYYRHYDVARAATLWDISSGLELSTRQITPPNADSIARPGLALGLNGWLLVYTAEKGLMVERLDACGRSSLLPFGEYSETVAADPRGRWVAASDWTAEGRTVTVASIENPDVRYAYLLPSRSIQLSAAGDGRHLYAIITTNDGDSLGDMVLPQDARANLYRLTLPDSLLAAASPAVAKDAMHCREGLEALKELHLDMPDPAPALHWKAVLSTDRTSDVMPVDLYFDDRDDLYAMYLNRGERTANEGIIAWDVQSEKPRHQNQDLYISEWSIRLENGWGDYDDREQLVHEYLTGDKFPVNTKYEHGHHYTLLKSDPDTGNYFFRRKDRIEYYGKQGTHHADIEIDGDMVDFAARNGRLAVLFTDGKVLLWPQLQPVVSPPEIYQIEGIGEDVYSEDLTLSGDGRFLGVDFPNASGDGPTGHGIYRLETGKAVGGGGQLTPFARDVNRGVVAGKYRHSLDVWDYDQDKMIARLPSHAGRNVDQTRLLRLRTAISESGRFLASAVDDGSIRVWDIDKRELVGEAQAGKTVTALAFNDDGSRLAAGLGDGGILLFEPTRQADHSSNDYRANEPFTEKDFKRDRNIYAIASSVNVREAPLLASSVIATIPIGQAVTFIAEQSRQHPNCKNREPHSQDYRWICVRVWDLETPADPGNSYWVVADLFSSTPPNLESILDYYRTIPKARLEERQKWLERAAAFSPLNQEIHDDLIDVLTRAGDEKALRYVRQAWDHYHSPVVPESAEEKVFYVYDGHRIEKLLTLKDDKLFPYVDYSIDPLPLHKRANLFYLYTSQLENLGIIQTTIQHDCASMSTYCPNYNPVRGLDLSSEELRHGVIATKEKIAPPEHSIETGLTSEEYRFFLNALQGEAEKESSDELKALMIEQIEAEEVSIVIGRLSTAGKRLVVSQVSVNSMSDAHYADLPFGAIYLVAEEQSDGSFDFSYSKDFDAIDSCGSSQPFDFDQNGTDEIVLYCEALEGTYGYLVLQRNAGNWEILR